MFRLFLSVLLVVALSGASAASVMHGVNHASGHSGHLVDMAEDDPSADAEKALADCCDAANSMGSASCFGDIAISIGIFPATPARTVTRGMVYAGSKFSGPTLAVPTGPPKA